MEKSSEICTCRHLLAFHPVAFPTAFQSAFCWSFHRLQWRKRCSRVCSVPLPHYQHLSSSRCSNHFRYVPVGACPLSSRCLGTMCVHDRPTFQFEKLGVQGLWVTTHDLVSRYVYPPSHFHQACGVSQLHDTKPEFQVDTSVITVKGSM